MDFKQDNAKKESIQVHISIWELKDGSVFLYRELFNFCYLEIFGIWIIETGTLRYGGVLVRVL